MTKIGIIGSRRRNTIKDKEIIEKQLLEIMDKNKLNKNNTLLVSGGCPTGGDRFAEDLAKKYELQIKIYKPDYSNVKSTAKWEYVKALFDRNTLVANNSEYLIACVASDRKGGTEDTIKKYLKMNKDLLFLV